MREVTPFQGGAGDLPAKNLNFRMPAFRTSSEACFLFLDFVLGTLVLCVLDAESVRGTLSGKITLQFDFCFQPK